MYAPIAPATKIALFGRDYQWPTKLKVYARESTIAEKLHAFVEL
jgi:hypothetical protein